MSDGELRAYGATDTGRQRTSNEDSFYCDPGQAIFVVIDGVGGYAAGEVAAAIAGDLVSRRLMHRTGTAEERLREAIAAANNEIFNQSLANPAQRGMACVLTAAIVEQGAVVAGHVGDTRLYEVRPDGLRKRTRDHSLVGLQEDAGQLSEEAARNHPLRSEILRDVGSAWHEPDDAEFVDIVRFPFDPESALLLCSDGLTDMVPSERIHRVVLDHAGRPGESVHALLRLANDAGGLDNITAIVVEGPAFAQAVARRPPAAPAAPRGVLPAEHPVPAAPPPKRRFGAGFAAGLLTGLVLALAPVLLLFGLLEARLPEAPPPVPSPPRTLTVASEGGADFQSLAAALAEARPGDVVQVASGVYRGPFVLRDSVAVVARVPGTATLVAGTARDSAVVVASGLRGARLEGVRIEPDTVGAMFAVGLLLRNADLVVAGVTVAGAAEAGVRIEGEAAPQLFGNAFIDNGGVGVHVRGAGARPVLLHNVIRGNGVVRAAPGVLVDDGARPVLLQNRIAGNAGAGVRFHGLPARSTTALQAQNDFGLGEAPNARGPVRVVLP